MTFVVGITGGIGSGKSVVAAMLGALGAEIVDTDAIAHELTAAGGSAMPLLIARFGAQMALPDGSLDRRAMRRCVFADPTARHDLESILHPLIRAESELRCAKSRAPYVVLAVPLLVEALADYRGKVSRVLVVDCDESLQVARVMARSGLSEAEVRAIMASQASRAERLAVADDVIDNSHDLESLQVRVSLLHASYLALAQRGANMTELQANH